VWLTPHLRDPQPERGGGDDHPRSLILAEIESAYIPVDHEQ